MNIAFVNNQYQLGGAETVIHQLRAGLRRAGHVSRLHVAEGKTYPAGEEVVPLYPGGLSRLTHSRLHTWVERVWPRFAWTDRSFRALARDRADLIHLHNFHGQYATVKSLAELVRTKPVVWTFHAFWGITGGCDHPKACVRYQESCGDCPQLGQWPIGVTDRTSEQLREKRQKLAQAPLQIIAPSRHLAAKVRESQVGRHWQVHHIPNGVDPGRFSPARKREADFRRSLGLAPEGVIVLVVNRDFQQPEKGFPMVKRALELIPPGSVQVVLAGRHSDWAAGQLPAGISSVSRGYVGSRDEMAKLYEAADLFLFASAAENFPCVILEAMSAGCCVVSTPTSGVEEQIDHGRTGFLAEHLSGKSLGLMLREVLALPDHGRRCGQEARRAVETQFSEETMVERHLALYAALLSGRS